ncbi:MAG: transporter ATP-binding protein [Acidobacteria bacterium]|nr:transporter ATP-binding protein [Acidobacteriota bacterium]
MSTLIPAHGSEPSSGRQLKITVQDLDYRRGTGGETRPLLGPVSFEVQGGEFLAVVGPPGSGKTVLLKLLAGTLHPSGGTILIEGGEYRPPVRDFGLVLDSPALLPWRTTMQNILLQAEIRGLQMEVCRNRARRLLAWFGLSGLEDRRPHELPPGAGQGISICRALVHAPSLLLMDQPFRMLESLILERMLDAFQRLWVETRSTAILCTSNLEEAVLLGDRVVVLSPRPGRILQIVSIELPRPRRLDRTMTPLIVDYCNTIRTFFRAQGVLP